MIKQNNRPHIMQINLIASDFDGDCLNNQDCAIARALNRSGYPCVSAGFITAGILVNGEPMEIEVTAVFLNDIRIDEYPGMFSWYEFARVKQAFAQNPLTTAYLQIKGVRASLIG
jgi:hypothetical protein